jgi:hypothetical protein
MGGDTMVLLAGSHAAGGNAELEVVSPTPVSQAAGQDPVVERSLQLAADPVGSGDGDAAASADSVAQPNDRNVLLSLLRQLRLQLEDPLLPMPEPRVVRRRLFSVQPSSVRRSRRIAAKSRGISGSTVKKAQRMIMQKLGICQDEARLSADQLREYAAIFSSPLGAEQVAALAALFGLDCPAVGEAELADVDTVVV